MTNIPALPQNIDPRIAAILRDRAAKGVVIEKTVQVQTRPVPLPTGPVPTTRPVPLPTGQSAGTSGGTFGTAPLPQVPALDTPATTTVPLSNSELVEPLANVLRECDRLIGKLLVAARSDGGLTMVEALTLAPEIRNIVSEVVGKLLPEIKGTSARELVILVLAQLLQQYLAPRLPLPLRGWLTAETLRSLVKGLEFAYTMWVKPRLSKSAALAGRVTF
ncbi:hypothetical protein [Deinococcus sp. Leaf326]|uniref:hypothetical protein n=1 Tax=Deinococcus sp. Leaf326 TaxID=1736338 RepID=UPI0006FB99FE|nr:hypothetical protein [Deinococcus sp. Leaf326]KQR33108.1 hypothetical protein ASF71_16585 [Deinococcus sp. Leaf326]